MSIHNRNKRKKVNRRRLGYFFFSGSGMPLSYWAEQFSDKNIDLSVGYRVHDTTMSGIISDIKANHMELVNGK